MYKLRVTVLDLLGLCASSVIAPCKHATGRVVSYLRVVLNVVLALVMCWVGVVQCDFASSICD